MITNWKKGEPPIPKQHKKSNRGFSLVEILTVVFILAVLVSMIIPNLRRAVQKAHLAGCQSNLRNIAVALKIYGTDHDEVYPDALSSLTPDHLKLIPTCPSVGVDTYSPGYTLNDSKTVYTVFCKGLNHSALGYGENEPYYDLNIGLGP